MGIEIALRAKEKPRLLKLQRTNQPYLSSCRSRASESEKNPKIESVILTKLY